MLTRGLPIIKQRLGLRRTGRFHVPLQEQLDGRFVDLGLVAAVGERAFKDRIVAHHFTELVLRVVLVSEPAGHAVPKPLEKPPRLSTRTVGHVFAAEIADTFDHGRRAGVTHRKAVAGLAMDKRAAAGRAEEREVTDQNVLAISSAAPGRGLNDNLTTTGALADPRRCTCRCVPSLNHRCRTRRNFDRPSLR